MRLLDIEGTVCPVTFVHDVLFPYARERLAAFVTAHAGAPEVAAAAREAGIDRADLPALIATLGRWMDEDRKVAALKALQGWIWRQGYVEGVLRAPLYDDVVPALDRWRAAGEPIAVFSSGSVEAQRLFFGHTLHGDLVERFAGFFDTGIGPKREPGAYLRIAEQCRVAPADLTFYSDLSTELDAAAEAGLATVHVVRDAQGSSAHRRVATFDAE